MNKFLALSFTSLFLVACNSDDSTTENTQSANIAQPSLAQIAGVWDFTETSQLGEDQIYFAINSDTNEYVIYDYLADSYDNGPDCYLKVSEVITDLGDGLFELSQFGDDYFQVNFSITNYQLNDNYETYPRSLLTESDFTPLCDFFDFDVEPLKSLTSEKRLKIFNLK